MANILRVILVVALLVLGSCGSSYRTGGVQGAADSVLGGDTRSILVNGYSTSYAWPEMLQDMLDAHAGGQRKYFVVNSVIGGAPVETWIAATGSQDHTRTIVALERDFLGPDPRLLGDAPRPTIVICQQSLQLTGDQRGPVKAAHDMAGAELGADALEALGKRLHAYGMERVYIATHIYKKPVEPEVGNERVALARLLSRGIEYIEAGPDVWEPTRRAYPGCFEDDGLHPNEGGMKIMAEGWYRTLAGEDAREDVVRGLWAREYDVNKMMRAYLAWRRTSR